MNKLGIIIQARSGSKRFPKKIFQIIGKKSILEHVISRLKKIKLKKKIIIATTKHNDDRIIKNIAKKNKCEFFFGSENNVLQRFYLAAKKFKICNIVRICADSPFIDPEIIKKAVNEFKKGNFDVISNTYRRTYPKGMSVEVFSLPALKKASFFAKSKAEKEHITKVFYKYPNLFKIKNLKNNKQLADYSFVIDYPLQLNYLRKIYSKLIELKIENKYKLKNLIQIAKTI